MAARKRDRPTKRQLELLARLPLGRQEAGALISNARDRRTLQSVIVQGWALWDHGDGVKLTKRGAWVLSAHREKPPSVLNADRSVDWKAGEVRVFVTRRCMTKGVEEKVGVLLDTGVHLPGYKHDLVLGKDCFVTKMAAENDMRMRLERKTEGLGKAIDKLKARAARRAGRETER